MTNAPVSTGPTTTPSLSGVVQALSATMQRSDASTTQDSSTPSRNITASTSSPDAQNSGSFQQLLRPANNTSGNNASSNNAPAKDNTPSVATSGNQLEVDSTQEDTTTDAASQATATLMAVLLSMQTQTQTASSAPQETTATEATAVDASAPSPASDSSASLEDLLKQLMTLLQGALQDNTPQAASPSLPAPAENSGTETADASTSDSTSSPSQDLMAALQSLLQLLTTPQTASQPVATQTTSQDALSIGETTTSSTATAPASSLLSSLQQLAALLEPTQQAPSSTAAEPTDTLALAQGAPLLPPTTPSTEAADAPAPAPALPAKSATGKEASNLTSSDNTSPTSSQPPALQELQKLVKQVVDTLSSKEASALPPQHDAAKTDDTTTPTALPVAPQSTAPQPAAVDFSKTLQQATTPQTPATDQVLVHIKNAVADGSSQIRIQLHPEELGKVDVQLSTDSSGKTGITITADNRHTLAMLQNEARALESALRDIGLRTDAGGLNFNLRDSGQDARNASKQQQGGYTKVAQVDEIEDIGLTPAGVLYSISAPQGLDIRV